MLRLDREWTTLNLLLVAGCLAIVMALVLLLLTGLAVLGVGFHQFVRFSQASSFTPGELISYGVAGLTREPVHTQGRVNFLVLGLDTLPGREGATILTDTILLLSLELETGELTALSLPRDLWLPEYQTKINTLYQYGLEENPDHPQALPTRAVSELAEIPIHHTLVITLEQLAEIIDLVGGVEVVVAESFYDPTFPRPGVDVSVENDPDELYTTVTFEAGRQTLTGDRALEYVRSRKSAGPEGGDEARTRRQQQVIAALIDTFRQPDTLTQPSKLADLLRVYRRYFLNQLSLGEALALGRVIWPHREQIELIGQTLSIADIEPGGVLVHPPLSAYNGQWVYTYRDLEQLRSEVHAKLFPTQTTTPQ